MGTQSNVRQNAQFTNLLLWVTNPFVRTSMTVRFAICVLAVAGNETASGQIWMKTGAPSNSWSAVACSANGTTVVAACNPARAGQIYVSTNSGADWSVTSAPTL